MKGVGSCKLLFHFDFDINTKETNKVAVFPTAMFHEKTLIVETMWSDTILEIFNSYLVR